MRGAAFRRRKRTLYLYSKSKKLLHCFEAASFIKRKRADDHVSPARTCFSVFFDRIRFEIGKIAQINCAVVFIHLFKNGLFRVLL